MRLRIDLDAQAYETLVRSGHSELRPPQMQAEVLLRRALGLPVPKEALVDSKELVPAGADRE